MSKSFDDLYTDKCNIEKVDMDEINISEFIEYFHNKKPVILYSKNRTETNKEFIHNT